LLHFIINNEIINRFWDSVYLHDYFIYYLFHDIYILLNKLRYNHIFRPRPESRSGRGGLDPDLDLKRHWWTPIGKQSFKTETLTFNSAKLIKYVQYWNTVTMFIIWHFVYVNCHLICFDWLIVYVKYLRKYSRVNHAMQMTSVSANSGFSPVFPSLSTV
jgi:hypothetical protein